MKITEALLKGLNVPCADIEYISSKGYLGLDAPEFLRKLIADKKLFLSAWIVVRIMGHKERIKYIFYMADNIKIYKKHHVFAYELEETYKKILDYGIGLLRLDC